MKKKTGRWIILFLMVMLTLGAHAETLTISLVGDCTIGSIRYLESASSFTSKMKKLGFEYPFSLFSERFLSDDLTVANCEGVFTNRRTPAKKDKLSLSATPDFAEIFRLGGVDAVNTENNHTYDFGRAGRNDTLEALDAQEIGHFGGGELFMTEMKGVKIGMTGYTFPHRNDISRQKADIEQLKAAGCDLIIVSMHWGREEKTTVTKEQRRLGPELIDAGADIVFGHGPHVLQPIEMYNGKPIFYSLANFTFGANAGPKDPDTAAISLEYDWAQGVLTLKHLEAIPARMHDKKDYRPYEYTEEKDRERVFQKLIFKNAEESALPSGFELTGIAEF